MGRSRGIMKERGGGLDKKTKQQEGGGGGIMAIFVGLPCGRDSVNGRFLLIGLSSVTS